MPARRETGYADSSKITLDNYDKYIIYLEEFKVIVCRLHKSAVQNLDRHLRDKHKVGAAERTIIVRKFQSVSVQQPSEIIPPHLPRQPIEALGAPLDGCKCAIDDCLYITINTGELKKHCRAVHRQTWAGDTEQLYRHVKVQSLFRTGGLQRYFVVRSSNATENDRGATDTRGDGERVDALLTGWQATRERYEEQMQILDAEVAKTDKTGWWNRTGWPKRFAERNLVHLAHSVRLPNKDERLLKHAAELVELLIERAVAGLSSLPRETRRWLRSAKRGEVDQRPLSRLQNPESQARYASYIVMFVCHVLRIVAREHAGSVSRPIGKSHVNNTSLPERECSSSEGSNSGEKSSEYDDNDADTNDDDDSDECEDDNDESSDDEGDIAVAVKPKLDPLKDAYEMFPWYGEQKHLAQEFYASLTLNEQERSLKALLKLMQSFIFQDTGNDPFNSGLIHFLTLLGIDEHTMRLRKAQNVSYMIAGIVYCLRVLSVEALLPMSRRQAQTDVDRDMFLQKRHDFLADGSFSPMSELLSLLAFSKHIAYAGGNSGNAFWSFDKRIFYLNGRPIVIRRFQQMVQDIVTEVEDTFWQDLLWITDRQQRFAVKLEGIVDDVNFSKRGMSFINNKRNDLHDGLAWTLSRAMRTVEGQSLYLDREHPHLKRIKSYVRCVERWLELLLVAVHFSSGQPGRGTEITSIRRINGVLQDRNIFVVDGQVMTVIRYHKSQSQWDKPKIVPRFLPWRLGQIMVLYLAYLQPFYEYLSVSHLGHGFSDYVWADQHGPWSTDRLTRIIKRQTGKRLDTILTTLNYRHVAVGIGRVVVGEGFSRGYEDEVGEVEELEVDEDGEDVLELQNARTTAAGLAHYSVRSDIIKHLSIRSIDAFRPLSELWHRFLGLASRQRDLEPPIDEVKPLAERPFKRACSESTLPPQASKQTIVTSSERDQAQMESMMYTALRRAVGQPDAKFKSTEQEQAVFAIVSGQTPLVVVLPTGGGKSLLFTLPACVDDAGVTLVVVPFRALIIDLVKRIQARGIECIEWRHDQVDWAAIVVVSADVAGDVGFMRYAALLDAKRLLRRVVLDECHLVCTANDWRQKLAGLRNLRMLCCQFVLLTATLPPIMEQDLAESMLIRCATYIRASTVRPNLRYSVSHCKWDEEQKTAIDLCRRQQRRLRNGLKGVVYCRGRAECESIAQALRCGFFHAEAVDRGETVRQWVSEGGLIVATTALGTGVDFPGIVLTVHVGMPWGMIDYAQESGRAGRGGELADCVIVVGDKRVENRTAKAHGDANVWAMGQFIEGEGCRRGAMSWYLDGQRVECGDIESAGCDRCGEGLAEWRATNVEWTKEWERVERVLEEVREGCAICWVLEGGEEWREHRTERCRCYVKGAKQALDEFRRGIVYEEGSHSCTKCGVCQALCATGKDIEAACQWGGVMVGMWMAGMGFAEGEAMARGLGFEGEREDMRSYGLWLGRRHRKRIWGEVMSNGMAMVRELVNYLSR